MEKRAKSIESLLFVFMVLFHSCVTSDDFEIVMDTDIPVSELKKEVSITTDMFHMITQGKYYKVSEYYCRWKGETLVYIQTGKDYYGLKGDLGKMGIYGDDHGDTFVQFDETVIHLYNDQYYFDDRYDFSYHEEDKSMEFPIVNADEMHLCRILYIDDDYIIVETDVYKPYITTPEARRAASRAKFVLLRFKAVKPPQNFLNQTDWEVRYPTQK